MSIVFVDEEMKEVLHALDENGMSWIRVELPQRVAVYCEICGKQMMKKQGHAWYSVDEAALHCRNCITRVEVKGSTEKTRHGWVAINHKNKTMWWTFRKTVQGVKEAIHTNYPMRSSNSEDIWKEREARGYRICSATTTLMRTID